MATSELRSRAKRPSTPRTRPLSQSDRRRLLDNWITAAQVQRAQAALEQVGASLDRKQYEAQVGHLFTLGYLLGVLEHALKLQSETEKGEPDASSEIHLPPGAG